MTILVINAGSSSVKFSLFEGRREPALLLDGKVEDIGGSPVFTAGKGREALPSGSTHEEAIGHILCWIDRQKHGAISAAVHRVVHGGTDFREPVLVTEAVLGRLRALNVLAPLHQPHNLAAIDIVGKLKPGLRQLACFDTAFHAGHGPLFSNYALPHDMAGRGVRRYGFHGLSYEWIARVLEKDHPALFRGRVVVAHLGNGASLCAMLQGKSIDTTMGMTALDGLPMGTRCGSLDPGAVIYMLRDLGMTAEEVENMLYNDSGLKGLSGMTNDVRRLLESHDSRARFALDYFCLKAAQFIGMMAVALGGMDGLVFTGGIGENADDIREDILGHIAFLRPFEALVIPANEERMMALHGIARLGNGAA